MSLGTHACVLISDGWDAYLYGFIFDDLEASQSDRENQIRIHLEAIRPRYLILSAFARKADGDDGGGCQIGRRVKREGRTKSHHGCMWLCCDTGGASFNVVRNTSPGNNKYRSRSLFTLESILRA